MRILLDNRETSLRADTVAVALQEAAILVERTGRMIVEVEVDGTTWGEEDLADASHTARGAVEVRFATAHPAELLRDTLAHATDAVLNAEQIQRNAARLLQANRDGEGLQSLLEALAIWGSVQTAVSRGLELGVVSRDSLKAGGIDLDGAVAVLDKQLRALRDAMQSQDPTAVSDCLMYEFPATAKRFAETLAAMTNAVAKIASDARSAAQ
jgi:hypothetical protein